MKSVHDLDKELAKVIGQIEALILEIHKRKTTARLLNQSTGQNGTFKIQVQLGWDFFIDASRAVNSIMVGFHTGSLNEFYRFTNPEPNGNSSLMGEEVIVFSPIDNDTDVSLFNVAILYTNDIAVKGA